MIVPGSDDGHHHRRRRQRTIYVGELAAVDCANVIEYRLHNLNYSKLRVDWILAQHIHYYQLLARG